MPTIDSDGCPIYWEESGPSDAPPLLLVMGLGLSARSWDQLPQRLSNRFRVIVFDNRGTGRSGKRPGLHGMRRLGDDAAAVLRAAGVSEARPAFAFGISLGGMIAQELALRHPRLVRALALGATNMGPRRSAVPSLRSMLKLLALVTVGPGKEYRRLSWLCVSPEFAQRGPEDFDRWRRGLDRASPLWSLLQLVSAAGHSTHARLPSLQMPTLLIAGDKDRIIPFDNSRRMARLIPGAKLVTLEGAGHVFPLEQPQRTVDALVEHFLGARPS
jgi:pimeloyl-ACP methyl ester carboxylesterase